MLKAWRRYWIKFDFSNYAREANYLSIIGYGVTEADKSDALKILSDEVFEGHDLLPIISIQEDVKMSDLDQNHVVPNISVLPFKRGIWYPAGLEFIS